MSAPTTDVTTAHPLPSPADLARQIDDALGPAPVDGSMLLRLEATPEEPTLGVLHLDGGSEHPVDALLGIRADASWAMVGVVVHGRATLLDEPEQEPTDVRIVHIVARDGHRASVVRRFDGSGHVDELRGGEGHLIDACQRILGLPTAAPVVTTLHWYAADWLDRLMAEVAAHPAAVPNWSAAARLHQLAPRRVDLPGVFAGRIGARAAEISWADLRRRAVAGDGGWPVSPEVAAWMDDGMFARWLLRDLPDPIDLLIELSGVLTAAVVRSLVSTLETWELW